MRKRHAAVLSVVAVLTAGMAAAIVNTRALAGYGAHADIALSSVPTLADATSTDGSTTTVTTVNTQRVFTIGDAGMLTLDRANGALVVISVAPASGWQLAGVTHVSADEINVELTSPADHATVVAIQSADGIVVTTTETISTSVPAAPPPSTSSPAIASPSATTPESGRPASTMAATPATASPITTTTKPTTTTTTTTPTTTTTTTTALDHDTPGSPAPEPDGDRSEPDD